MYISLLVINRYQKTCLIILFCFRRDVDRMVLPGLLLGFLVPGGYLVPLSHGLPRGRRITNRRGKVAGSLHELYYILHRLSLPATARLPLSINRIQLHLAFVQTCENIQVLGLHGPNRETYELSELVQIDEFNSLFISDISLEWVLVPYNI